MSETDADPRQGSYPTPTRQTTYADWETYWKTIEAPDQINYTPQIIETLSAHIELHDCQVLEIGAGTGGNSSTLSSLGAAVTALDLVSPALQRIVRTASMAGVDLDVVQGDAWHLPFRPGAFDLIFHQGFLEHFGDPRGLVREQRRVLRTGGHILIDVPQRYNWFTLHKRRLIRANRWPYGGWEREFSFGELVTLLKEEGFRIIDAYGRGYYPRPWQMLRNLSKIEQKVFKRKVFPDRIWRRYDACWHRLEKSRLGCHTLQCLGVLAQARADR